MDIGNLISGSSVFCKSSLNIGKFTVHVLLKPGLENFEHYFAGSVSKEFACNADLGFIPRLGRSPGEGKGYPLLYSGLESSQESDTTERLSLSMGGLEERVRVVGFALVQAHTCLVPTWPLLG